MTEATFPDHFRLPPPVAELVGFKFVYAREGSSRMELDVTERHANPMGTVHGGILCDLADAAMGTAYAAQLATVASFATLERKMNFQRPFSFRMTANWPTYLVPACTIVFTITVPFGYLEPTFRLLA